MSGWLVAATITLVDSSCSIIRKKFFQDSADLAHVVAMPRWLPMASNTSDRHTPRVDATASKTGRSLAAGLIHELLIS